MRTTELLLQLQERGEVSGQYFSRAFRNIVSGAIFKPLLQGWGRLWNAEVLREGLGAKRDIVGQTFTKSDLCAEF